MNCENYQEQISKFVDGELSIEEEGGMFIHLGACLQCRSFLKNLYSLKSTLALSPPPAVPKRLDRRVAAHIASEKSAFAWKDIFQRIQSTQYSYRAIGLAIILSVLFAFIFSAFLHKSNETGQTIVCLNPLPEVEVTGYIVYAP